MKNFPALVGIFFVALVFAVVATLVLINISPKLKQTTTTEVVEQEPTTVRLYLVKIDDKGQAGTEFGCGDSLVPITKEIATNSEPLKPTIQRLLSLRTAEFDSDGLYTAFSNSDLSVSDIKITGETAQVYLTGDLSLGGVCDNPRVENQLSATALQFPHIKQVEFFINNTPLSEILSPK